MFARDTVSVIPYWGEYEKSLKRGKLIDFHFTTMEKIVHKDF